MTLDVIQGLQHVKTGHQTTEGFTETVTLGVYDDGAVSDVSASNPLPTKHTPSGDTPGSYIATGTSADVGASAIMSSPGVITMLVGTNKGVNPAYLKIFDKSSEPVLGTDIPKLRIMLPAAGGNNVPIPANGIYFANGCRLAITTGYADNDTTGVAAGDVILNWSKK